MKQVCVGSIVGSAKDDLAAFPKSVRTRAGHELFMVQAGRDPDSWKPMSSVGPGACEIRVREPSGACRVACEHAEGVKRG